MIVPVMLRMILTETLSASSMIERGVMMSPQFPQVIVMMVISWSDVMADQLEEPETQEQRGRRIKKSKFISKKH